MGMADPIINAIQNNANFSEIKSYETKLLKDDNKYTYPYCAAYRLGKNKVDKLADGKTRWAYTIKVMFGFKTLESEQEKAENFDEYFDDLLNSDPSFGRNYIASGINGSDIYTEVSGANVYTTLEIDLTVEVMK